MTKTKVGRRASQTGPTDAKRIVRDNSRTHPTIQMKWTNSSKTTKY
jgi:hypothetical protein